MGPHGPSRERIAATNNPMSSALKDKVGQTKFPGVQVDITLFKANTAWHPLQGSGWKSQETAPREVGFHYIRMKFLNCRSNARKNRELPSFCKVLPGLQSGRAYSQCTKARIDPASLKERDDAMVPHTSPLHLPENRHEVRLRSTYAKLIDDMKNPHHCGLRARM
jgi:hypothetical protein